MNRKEQLRENRRRSLRAVIRGTAQRPRLVVRRSLNRIYAQIIDDSKGVTLCAASDTKLKEKGKLVRAKATGQAIAGLAKERGIQSVVFDRAGYKYHGRVQALADGAREGGLQF